MLSTQSKLAESAEHNVVGSLNKTDDNAMAASQEAALRKEEDARRKEEDARRKEEENARKKEDDARRKEDDALRKEEDAARKKAEDARKKEEDARRKAEDFRRKEEDAAREAQRREEEAARKASARSADDRDYRSGHHDRSGDRTGFDRTDDRFDRTDDRHRTDYRHDDRHDRSGDRSDDRDDGRNEKGGGIKSWFGLGKNRRGSKDDRNDEARVEGRDEGRNEGRNDRGRADDANERNRIQSNLRHSQGECNHAFSYEGPVCPCCDDRVRIHAGCASVRLLHGQRLFFCSDACKLKFQYEPLEFVAPQHERMAHQTLPSSIGPYGNHLGNKGHEHSQFQMWCPCCNSELTDVIHSAPRLQLLNGQTIYFRCYECVACFLRDPTRYFSNPVGQQGGMGMQQGGMGMQQSGMQQDFGTQHGGMQRGLGDNDSKVMPTHSTPLQSTAVVPVSTSTTSSHDHSTLGSTQSYGQPHSLAGSDHVTTIHTTERTNIGQRLEGAQHQPGVLGSQVGEVKGDGSLPPGRVPYGVDSGVQGIERGPLRGIEVEHAQRPGVGIHDHRSGGMGERATTFEGIPRHDITSSSHGTYGTSGTGFDSGLSGTHGLSGTGYTGTHSGSGISGVHSTNSLLGSGTSGTHLGSSYSGIGTGQSTNLGSGYTDSGLSTGTHMPGTGMSGTHDTGILGTHGMSGTGLSGSGMSGSHGHHGMGHHRGGMGMGQHHRGGMGGAPWNRSDIAKHHHTCFMPLEQQGERVDATVALCPIDGNQVSLFPDNEVFAEFLNGQRIFLCCEACINAFLDNTTNFLKPAKAYRLQQDEPSVCLDGFILGCPVCEGGKRTAITPCTPRLFFNHGQVLYFDRYECLEAFCHGAKKFVHKCPLKRQLSKVPRQGRVRSPSSRDAANQDSQRANVALPSDIAVKPVELVKDAILKAL